MIWTEQQVRTLHREYYEDGVSLAALGERLGVSHETIRQKFLAYHLPRRPVTYHAAQERARREQLAEEQRGRIIELYKQHGTIDAVIDETSLPRNLIAPIVDTIPNREAYRHRGAYQTRADEDLIADLRIAAEHGGEPLSSMVYQALAPQHGLASYDTVVRAFKTWPLALEAAGIQGNEPRGRRPNTITPEQCVEAVTQCLRDHDGQRVSYLTYRAWARGKAVPSGPTVRKRVRWNEAVEQALDKLARA